MGIAFGRTRKKSPHSESVNGVNSIRTWVACPSRGAIHRYWLNTTFEEVGCLYGRSSVYSRSDCKVESEHTPQHLDRRTVPFPLPHYPSIAEADQFLFYYFSSTCTVRRSLVDYENPWRSVVLPLCYQSEGLLHIAIAWAAHTLRNQCDDRDVSRYEQLILVHKCRSLEYLRNMVPQNTKDAAITLARTKEERDALLLLVMFHCLLEIASGSTKEWTYHMKGALMIMKFYTAVHGGLRTDIFSEEVLELVYSFFIEKDTFLGTTLHNADNLHWSTEVPSMFPFLSGRGSMKVNPCLGLSTELLDIISSISSEVRRRRMPLRRASQAQSPAQEFTRLRLRLIHLERLSHFGEPGSMALLSTAFEEATWIYLHHALGKQPRDSDIIQKIHLPKLLNTLEQIHRVQGPLLGFIPYPMWALFIASCVVLEDDRVRILEWFSVLKCNKPISNVPSTMAAVKAIWKRRDLESGDSSPIVCQPIWTAAISQLGWKMPFT
ncbi:fungal-specific transcription factor domain-containing protein [Aspergillus heterothallicus]